MSQHVVAACCNRGSELQLILAPGSGNAVIRRLAYDAVLLANLHHDDWGALCQGLSHDLVAGQVAEVQLRALELVGRLPELHIERLMEEGALEGRLLEFVAQVRLPCLLSALLRQAV